MAISPISNAAAVGNTVAMPSHTTSDLILASVWRTGSTTAPTIPGGWTLVKTQTGTTSWMGVYKKIAASSSETTGTWTSATAVEINVYRGASGTGTGPTGGTGTGTTITYPAITLNKTNSTSWVYRTACAKAATNITTNTPTGYTARGGVATTASAIRGCDSNAGLASSPSTGTQTVSGSGVWIAISVEILMTVPPGAAMSTLTDDFNTGSTPDAGKWTGSGALSSGELLLTNVDNLISVATYDLTGSEAFIQAKSAWDGGGLQLATGGVGPFWAFDATTAYVFTPVGSVPASRTHVNGDWYRIRESGGTLFWDYRSDGGSWTNAYSEANSITITNLTVGILGPTNAGTSHLDNFNTAPAPSNTGAFFAMF